MSISLKNNIIFNYVGQFYSMGISILILPLFLKVLGSESYGIVAFYMMAQGWMTVLDLGMSPTLSREIAVVKEEFNQSTIYRLKALIRSLEVIFISISVAVILFSLKFSDFIALKWLKYNVISEHVVNQSVFLIGVIISIRWFCGLYRSGINGYEEQVWLNKITLYFTTLKYPAALGLIYISNGNILLFFYYQIIIALFEILVIAFKFYKLLPSVNVKIPIFSLSEILRVKSFAGTTAFTACLWVFLTQFDKLLMSKFLSLEEFGYYSLVLSVSTGIMLLSGPISVAILPRLTAIYSAKANLASIYLKSTQWVSITVLPIALAIIILPYKILLLWTSNIETAQWGASLLTLYSVGSLCVVYSAFLHYLQYAHGNLRYHLAYAVVSSLITIPAIYFSALYYSVSGVALVWLIRGVIDFLFWSPFIHHKFLPGYHIKWMFYCIVPFVLADTIIIYMFKLLFNNSYESKLIELLVLCTLILLVVCVNFFLKFILSRFKKCI